MRSVILGTAGHVDHGKTSLVKALTGVDTDRLAEEHERGISIELGFARLDLGDLRFGIVDVPGHERFVKNMLAGAGGVDLVALVVAADEGVMPQTREHLDIIHFLGVEHGVVVLTKRDLVDEETCEIAQLDVEEALIGTCLEGAPVVPVSSVTREGLDALCETLRELAAKVHPRPADGPYRLPIDRSFVMEGFGTVVTGTSFAGSVRVGDHLDLLPAGKKVRVRRVQVHGREAEVAEAGQRTALALHGVAKDEVDRGDQLVSPGSLSPSSMLDVRIHVSPRWVRPLRNRERVRFHLAASEDLARVVLLDRDELAPGEDALAQIRMETPVVPSVGDRFVLRSYSPMIAMAGGVIIDPHPTKHRRYRPDELEAMERREGGGPLAILLEKVHGAGLLGVKTKDLVDATSLSRDEVDAAVREEEQAGTVRLSANGRVLSADAWRIARRGVLEEGARFRERHPLRWGPTREELRTAVGQGASTQTFGALLDELAEEGAVRLAGEKVRVGEGDVEFDGPAKAERDRLEALYRAAMCAPPERAEAVGAGQADLANEVLLALADQGVLEKVTPDFFLHRDAIARAVEVMHELNERDGNISVGTFRDALGISRKYAVPLLEYFDVKRITRRDGDIRILR
ncbi:selenocysteine-specific translation elongation factor [bacterium]|nr:selenocysteine-specific translation elongation factor [bacterium]